MRCRCDDCAEKVGLLASIRLYNIHTSSHLVGGTSSPSLIPLCIKSKYSKPLAKMRGLLLALSATFASAASIARDALPAGAAIIPATNLEPRGSGKPGHKDKWGCNKPEYRHKVTIRASKNETDDISADLLWAFHKANRGGTVYLKEGSTYVIGKKLDLTFLNDVHLQLDGELKFTDDIEYWQANNFYYDFQKSITWVVWGGEKIKIYTNSGTGVLNGNGQAW